MKTIKRYLLAALSGSLSAFFLLVIMGGTTDGLSRISVFGNTSSGWRVLNTDKATRAFETIDYPHHEIHDGSSYNYTDVVTLNSASQDYLITTPNTTTWGHFTYEVDASGSTDLYIYEDTARAGTTPQTEWNRDRNVSPEGNTLTVDKGTGAGADGTLILHRSSASRISTFSREATERILLQNKKYIFRVTTNGNYTVSISLNWYEHANKT